MQLLYLEEMRAAKNLLAFSGGDGYDNVLMAHQLDDRLEWFLMQFCKGSGIVGLGGLRGVSRRQEFRIIRPLIECAREEIYAYLHRRGHRFFEDSSNADARFVRNFFRHNVVRALMPRFTQGVRRSFRILEQESEGLFPQIHKVLPSVFVMRRLAIERADGVLCDCYGVDYALKRLGYVMSAKQREELIKSDFCCHIAQEYVVDRNAKFVFVAKIHTPLSKIPKTYRERYRLAKIPPKIRPILFQNAIIDSEFEGFVRSLEELG